MVVASPLRGLVPPQKGVKNRPTMSTPSTAIATHPNHQYYPHHQTYNPGLAAYSLNSPLTNGYRVANSHSNGYPPPRQESTDVKSTPNLPKPSADVVPPAPSSAGNSAMSHSSSKRRPDWAEFYKNGMPKEIIVIDDSPEPSSVTSKTGDAGRSGRVNGALRHADKKRKTGQSAACDPVYQQHTSYSTTQTPYAENTSSHNTVSTDRTTSAIHTTAPTSLGSQASNGTHNTAPMEEGMVGQKRKRSTRQVAQDEGAKEAKRRHIERPSDPWERYLPPPDPPVKAKDVYVQVVHDVRQQNAHPKRTSGCSQFQRSQTKDQTCDDDDGHYVVNTDADLTDRCKRRVTCTAYRG